LLLLLKRNIFILGVITLLHMYKNYNKYKVLKVFFNDPLPEDIGFHLRQISRITKIAPKSVSIYLKKLINEGFVKRKKLHSYWVYYANRDNNKFTHYKKIDIVNRITDTGLLDYLYEQILPDTIILFGSASMGQDLKSSDIDLCVISKEKKLNLTIYEKKLKRKINILFTEEFKVLSNELKNNILNGVILKGYLKVY
jgi:predicted nucleotidyltransferase